jgi:hypothetical protein
MAELSAKTLAEMAAGRAAIMEAVGDELLKNGNQSLRKKFPTYLPSSHLKLVGETWVVDVRIQLGSGKIMTFTDPYHGFPSDLLITEMMLVAP